MSCNDLMRLFQVYILSPTGMIGLADSTDYTNVRAFTILAAIVVFMVVFMVVFIAVAILAPFTGLLTFAVCFLLDFAAGALLIRDFFWIAIVSSPGWILDCCLAPYLSASSVPNCVDLRKILQNAENIGFYADAWRTPWNPRVDGFWRIGEKLNDYE